MRFGCSAVFEAASYALRSIQVELKRSTRGLPWLKLPESRNDVLPKSNSESHRCSRLCPWNGDTAGEVQKERFPGHIPGRLWFSDSLIAAVSNTHTHRERREMLCLQLRLISLPLQTKISGRLLILLRMRECSLLCSAHTQKNLIKLHRRAAAAALTSSN